MAPPGRRRPLNSLCLLLTGLFLLAAPASAASAVLGIDLGTEYIKAALVKPGIPLEIVLSKDSKRKEVSAVAFKPSKAGQPAPGSYPERAFGGDALALAARYPGDVFPNLKPLLGLDFEDRHVLEEYTKRHSGVYTGWGKEKSRVTFISNAVSKAEDPFTVEELLAMELQNVKENAEVMAKSTIGDAVITIPTFWTADERRAVEVAAELAGLNTLALISDGMGVGLNYATSRTFKTEKEGKPEVHMVFDMGAGSTTATVLKFQGKTVKDVGKYNKTIQEVTALGAGWDRTLGGDHLNHLIIDDMVKKFVATAGGEEKMAAAKVYQNGRTAARLWREAEKLRQVLSANSEASSFVEGLQDDIDFRYKLSRADFEKMASDFNARVAEPIKKALSAAKMEFSDLDSVILHGGAVRTPFVQKRLEQLFKDPAKLRSNVNADESAVFGAAFKGAGLSPSFRVKEIRNSDVAVYPVLMKYQSNLKERSQKLFGATSATGVTKEMPLKMMGDFEFDLLQHVPDQITTEVREKQVLHVKTNNMTQTVTSLIDKEGCERDGIDTKVYVRLDPRTGLPETTRITVGCEVDEAEKKGSVVDGVKDFLGFGGKKDAQEPLDGEDAGPTEVVEEASSSSSSSSSRSSSSKKGKATDAAKKGDEAPTKRTVRINVSFTATPKGQKQITKDEFKKMKDRLTAYDRSDKARLLRDEALNVLESYTYRARDFLGDDSFLPFSTEDVRTKIESLVKATSEWIYGEGSSAPEDILRSKLKDLKTLIEPIQSRRSESTSRPEKVKLLQDALDQTKQLMIGVEGKIEEDAKKASEAAASAASSATDAAAEGASSVSSAVVGEETASSADPLDDLEDSTSSSKTSSTKKETATPFAMPTYTQDDLDSLRSKYDEIVEWMNEKTEAQKSVKEYMDPAFTSAELEARAKQLNAVVMELLQKSMRGAGGGYTPPKDKSSKSKSKSTKAKSKFKKAKATKSASTDDAEPTIVEDGDDVKLDDTTTEPTEDTPERAGERQKPIQINLNGEDMKGGKMSREEILEKVRQAEKNMKRDAGKKQPEVKDGKLAGEGAEDYVDDTDYVEVPPHNEL